MLATLQRKLYMSDGDFDLFLQELDSSGSIIAGSFPLVWACAPKPAEWHPRTKREVLTLAMIGHRLGLDLPAPALEFVGNWLQTSQLVSDMKNDVCDIDLFYSGRFNIVLQGWQELPIDQKGLYVTNPAVFSVRLLQRGSTKLNLISVLGTPKAFVDNFDFSFCRATLDSQEISMRGIVNLSNYLGALRYIEERIRMMVEYQRYNNNLPGLSQEEFCELRIQLVKEIADRLEKYDQRRFTFVNRHEAQALIASK